MMRRIRTRPSRRLIKILFGSPDRTLSTISVIQGFVSLLFSVAVYVTPNPTSGYLVVRDWLLVLTLVLIIVVLSLKYYKKDELVEHFRTLLSNQLISTHQLIDKFRDHFFFHIRDQLVDQTIALGEIGQIRRHYFNAVCHSVLFATRKLFQDYFSAKGFKVGEDLTLTFKLIITCDEAQEILNRSKGEKADKLSSKERYIVTAFRDPYTWEKKPERKEVKQIVYRVSENSTFDEVINKGADKFWCNDLRAMHETDGYRNQHEGWERLYNAVLAVPVRYQPDIDRNNILCYGVLAIDSVNQNGHDLFGDDITFNMLAHSADTLAIMLGHIDILRSFLAKS